MCTKIEGLNGGLKPNPLEFSTLQPRWDLCNQQMLKKIPCNPTLVQENNEKNNQRIKNIICEKSTK